jgi:hypothetical protein
MKASIEVLFLLPVEDALEVLRSRFLPNQDDLIGFTNRRVAFKHVLQDAHAFDGSEICFVCVEVSKRDLGNICHGDGVNHGSCAEFLTEHITKFSAHGVGLLCERAAFSIILERIDRAVKIAA